MRRWLILALLAAPAPAQLVDGVAARAGTSVITLSAVRRHLRMQAFFTRTDADLSPASRRAAAERLIDQALVRRELEFTRFAAPPDSDIDSQIERLLKERNEDAAALASELARYGFTLDDLRQELRYQLALLRFVDFRFSPGIQVSADEIEAAFRDELLAPAQKSGAPAPTLDEARPQIERLLIYRKTTAALEQWLLQARQQVKIRLFEGAFE